MRPIDEWMEVRAEVLARMPGSCVEYRRCLLPHPRAAGARPSASRSVGQIADYRFPPESEMHGMHVAEFPDRWAVVDDHARDPALGLNTVAGAAGLALLGSALGIAIGRSNESALLGGLLGLVAGGLLVHQATVAGSNRKAGEKA